MGGKAKPGKGGKREGAGRPLQYGEPTESIRLPVSIVNMLKDLGFNESLRRLQKEPSQ